MSLHREIWRRRMPFDDYEKVREIYMGTFGRAFLVHRVADRKVLSMKEFSFSELDPDERQFALREVQTLTSLKHPYIIRYCEKFMHDSRLCMVFDEGDDGNLWTFIRLCSRQRTVIPEVQVLRWFTQICLAVKYLHERPHPILHRDIKTQNIFLAKKDKEGTVAKLFVEFGPMKILDNPDSEVRASIGTHFCQCPEITNRLPYGTPADMWSLGCVLYEMCTAHMGWEAEDIPHHMENILISPLFQMAENYSPELGVVAGTLLEHDASERPSADALLKTSLLQAEMRAMLQGRHKEAAKAVEAPRSNRDGVAIYSARRERRDSSARAEAREVRDEVSGHAGRQQHFVRDYADAYNTRDGAYTARDGAYSARDGSYTARSQVRPLGDHNPRMPPSIRSASPGVAEAAKLLLMQESPRGKPRASSRTRNAPSSRASPVPSSPHVQPPPSPRTSTSGRARRREPSYSASPREELVEALAKLLLAAPTDISEGRW